MNDVAHERHPESAAESPDVLPAAPRPPASAAQTDADRAASPSGDENPPLPLPLPLPHHEHDAAPEPIDYALTARARRLLAPSTLPDLSVLPAPSEADPAGDPHDTRPARARALRRSGLGTGAIATQLRVSPELVEAWCRGVGAEREESHPMMRGRSRRKGRSRPTRGGGASTTVGPTPGPDTTPAEVPAARPGAAPAVPVSRPTTTRLTGAAVAAMALTAASAETSDYAVVLRTTNQRLAAVAVRWLCAHAGAERSRIRVVVEVPAGEAGDLVAHRWSAALGLSTQQVRATGAAGGVEAVWATMRIGDPQVAGVVREWRAALLEAADPSVSS